MCTRRETGTEEVKMATRRSEVAGSGRGLPLKGPKQKNNISTKREVECWEEEGFFKHDICKIIYILALIQ